MNPVIDFLTRYSDQVLVGIVGGFVGALLTTFFRYIHGWIQAGRYRDADFHITATYYVPIESEPALTKQMDASQLEGKTHVQKIIWLGQEISLDEFISNTYILREIKSAMNETKNAGLLLGRLAERAERPLLKKILGYHSAIPSNDIVRAYKEYAGVNSAGLVNGIAPPTHEHYKNSPHRRVLRAMFIADRQLTEGLPPKDNIVFTQEAQAYRYETLNTLIEDYGKNIERYDRCRAYF